MACRERERVGRGCLQSAHRDADREPSLQTLPALTGFLPPWISFWRCELFSPLLDADAFWTQKETTAGVTQDSLLGKERSTLIFHRLLMRNCAQLSESLALFF